MPDIVAKRRHPVAFLVVLLVAWLVLFAMQALQRPFDGYMPAHIGAPGGSWLSGPLLAIPLSFLLPLAAEGQNLLHQILRALADLENFPEFFLRLGVAHKVKLQQIAVTK